MNNPLICCHCSFQYMYIVFKTLIFPPVIWHLESVLCNCNTQQHTCSLNLFNYLFSSKKDVQLEEIFICSVCDLTKNCCKDLFN